MTIAGQTAEELSESLDYQTKLNHIYKSLHEAESFEEIFWALEQDMLDLLGAERLTVYRKDASGSEIVSWFRTGNELTEIRVPLSPSSIAGYVAMSGKPVLINDVYDQEELAAVHPKLQFDYSYDQSTGFLTESMVVVPVKSKSTLLGVLQIINKKNSSHFSDQDVIHALAVANLIGQKFRYDLKTTRSPYEHLVQMRRLTMEHLEEIEEKAEAQNLPASIFLKAELELTPEELGESLEQFYQVPWLGYDVEIKPDAALLQNLNPEYLASHCWVPFTGDEGEAIVLIDNPNDTERIMEIQQLIDAPYYDFRVGLREDIYRYLGFEIELPEEIVDPEMNLEDIVGELAAAEEEKKAKAREKSKGKVEEELDDTQESDLLDENASSIVKLVNRLIIDAVEMNCSDIHVEPGKSKEPAVVRMRVDGMCREVLYIPATHIRAVVARIKVLSRLDIAEKRLPQDGKMAVRYNDMPLELRVATLPTVNGESAILRILASGDPLPYEKLGFSERNRNMLERMLTHPHGIILVVGPTGSGKTTTLHGLLGYINTPERKILTAEDPVEITQKGLQQVQIQHGIGLDFARALRAFLRCDPDVILIGEMRDAETAGSGMEAALTGHLVFSTLHTNSAPETVVRLLDMGLDPLNFADALVGVLAQRLGRTLCKDCKEKYKPEADEILRLKHAYGEDKWPELGLKDEDIELYRPVGCEKCRETGYRGRCGIHELLEATDEMKKLVSGASPVNKIRDQAVGDGMRTIEQDGVLKVLSGMMDWPMLRLVTGEK